MSIAVRRWCRTIELPKIGKPNQATIESNSPETLLRWLKLKALLSSLWYYLLARRAITEIAQKQAN